MFGEQIYIYYIIRPDILHFNEFDFEDDATWAPVQYKDGLSQIWRFPC